MKETRRLICQCVCRVLLTSSLIVAHSASHFIAGDQLKMTDNLTMSYTSLSTAATTELTASANDTRMWSTVDNMNATVASSVDSLLLNATQWYVTEAVNVTVNSTSSSDASRPISVYGIINGVCGSIMSLVTFFGQVMVFVVVSRDARLRTPGNFYIISLAIADMLISIMSMPVWTIYSMLEYWPVSQGWCDLWNIVDYVLCTVSIYTILFISVDRYLSLRYPLSYSLLKTPGKAIRPLVAIWIFTTVVYATFIGLTQHYLGMGRSPEQCQTYYLTNVYVTVGLCLAIHWTGVGGTAIFYVLIYRLVQKAGHVGERPHSSGPAVTKSSLGSSTTSIASSATVEIELSSASVNANPAAGQPSRPNTARNGANNGRKASTKKHSGRGGDATEEKDRKALRTIALLLVTFAFCWLPLSVVFVVVSVRPNYLSDYWMVGGYWLGYVNSMLNPVCYAIGNPYFRETLRKTLCRPR